MTVDGLVCHAAAPPAHGKAQPSCSRIKGHAGPHRIIRERDFSIVAEWTSDGYSIEPPAPKKPGTK